MRAAASLPGLHDHHIHLAAWAAALGSVDCGPHVVRDEADFAVRLAAPGAGWLRGIGYHESVAGEIDKPWLDRVAPNRLVRVQHRSGRMWVFNSAGLDAVLAGGSSPDGFERQGDQLTGRLFDGDDWLRAPARQPATGAERRRQAACCFRCDRRDRG